jgi:hypothetical protein
VPPWLSGARGDVRSLQRKPINPSIPLGAGIKSCKSGNGVYPTRAPIPAELMSRPCRARPRPPLPNTPREAPVLHVYKPDSTTAVRRARRFWVGDSPLPRPCRDGPALPLTGGATRRPVPRGSEGGACGGQREGVRKATGERGAAVCGWWGPRARLERNLSGGGVGWGGARGAIKTGAISWREIMAVMGTAQLPRPRCLSVCVRVRLRSLPSSDAPRVGGVVPVRTGRAGTATASAGE